MYSTLIRILLAILGLSPVLLSLYIVRIIKDYETLSFYFHLKSGKDLWQDISNLVETNFLLLLFLISVFLARWLVRYAKINLPKGRVEIKSIKPADINFFPILFSLVLPFYRIYDPRFGEIVYIVIFFVVVVGYGMISKGSYHFNLVLKLFLGYRHYEVATTGEVTYLILSKQKLVNRNQIKEYVSLTDHMLINVTPKT